MNKITAVIMVGALVFLSYGIISSEASAQGSIEDSKFSERLIHDGQRHRNAMKQRIVSSWLAGDNETVWMPDMFRMATACLNSSLLTGEPDEVLASRRGKEFAPSGLLCFLLEESGVDMDPANLFAGKNYKLLILRSKPALVSYQIDSRGGK